MAWKSKKIRWKSQHILTFFPYSNYHSILSDFQAIFFIAIHMITLQMIWENKFVSCRKILWSKIAKSTLLQACFSSIKSGCTVLVTFQFDSWGQYCMKNRSFVSVCCLVQDFGVLHHSCGHQFKMAATQTPRDH